MAAIGFEKENGLELSVVIATYNRGSLLKRLLDNLKAQTLPADKFEVVVVDDGSKTPVKRTLKGYDAPYRLSLLRQKNGGAAVARDNGIRHSSGEIVVITDDDMEVRSDFLEQHLIAHRQGADVVLGRIVEAGDFSAMPLHNRFQQHQFNRLTSEMANRTHIHGTALYTGNVSFGRKLYEKVGGFDLSLKQDEDRELGIRFEKAGARFAFSFDAAIVNHSDHTDFNAWLETSRRYGVLDWQISEKHHEVPSADPMHFFFLVHPISRPILASVLALPSISPYLVRSVMAVSDAVDNLKLDGLALKGVTLAYGIQYFRGVRDEAGSLGAVWNGWRRFLKKRRVNRACVSS